MRRKTLLILLILAAISFVVIPRVVRIRAIKTLWIAPSGETILQLRTGKQMGHIFVLTESNNRKRWWVRDVDAVGEVHSVVSGVGHPSALIPMSPLSFVGDHFVLCVRERGKLDGIPRPHDTASSYPLLDCDILRGRVIPIVSAISGQNLLGVRRAYSPDERYLIYKGYNIAQNSKAPRTDGVWIYDRLMQTSKLMHTYRGNETGSAGWDEFGNLYYFNRQTGDLLRGKADGELNLYMKLNPGS